MNPQASGIPPIPPDLRDELDQSEPMERAELECLWTLLESGRPEDVVEPGDADATWARLQADLTEAPAQPLRRAPDRSSRRAMQRMRPATRWIALAASALVAVLLGGYYWTQPVRHTAAPGAPLTLTLPDGSTVDLHGGSTLHYQRSFEVLPFLAAARRIVHLDGEAYFDVAHTGRPFSVETFNAHIDVLGTTFDVASWSNRGSTRVTLASGRVEVRAKENREAAVVLADAGAFTLVTDRTQAPTPPAITSLERTLVWRTGGFAVDNLPLGGIFEQLERQYGAVITIGDRVDTRAPMTLYYPTPRPVESILNDICSHRELSYRATSRGFEVFKVEVPR